MNVLFIYSLGSIVSPTKPLQNLEQIQFGISYISSVLKENKHNTKLTILSRLLGKKNNKIIDEVCAEFKPELICFTAVSTEYPFVVKIAEYIASKYPDIYLLAGGTHVSLNSTDASKDCFDAICIGEGEYPTLELIAQLDNGVEPSNIQNLWIKNSGGIEKNPTRPFLQNIDQLPFPDRGMWEEFLGQDVDSASKCSVMLGRGCPFFCTYCSNHALKKIASGRYVRNRSPLNITNEIKEIALFYPAIKEIYLEIETIGINNEWALELCSELRKLNENRTTSINFGVNLRIVPNMDLESLFGAFKEGNINFVNIGLESGSERVRREVLKRYYSNQDVISAVRLAHQNNLKVSFYNMLGLPGESMEELNETIRMNRICKPDSYYLGIFYPYPGTDLYYLCKKNGLLPKVVDVNTERRGVCLDLPLALKKKIMKKYIWFEYEVYKNIKPLYKILFKVLKNKLSTYDRLFYFARRITAPFFKLLER
jgi:anaerobic magnesium-protoporphyrin IX monomethyl ester cyclase